MNSKPDYRCVSSVTGKQCPDYMYSYVALRETWMEACRTKGAHCREGASHFFTYTLSRYLKNTVFVVAYGSDHTAGIFVDYKVYKTLKEKLEKAVDTSEKLPDVSPVKLSRKRPQIPRMFKTMKEFNTSIDQLWQKNHAIAKQRHLNGVHLLNRIAAIMNKKETVCLALCGEISDRNPKRILQMGWVVFELHARPERQECHHYIVEENSLGDTNNSSEDLGNSEVLRLAEILSRFRDHISQAHFLLVHSMSSAEVRTFFASHGVNTGAIEVIDTLTLHFTICPDSRNQNSFEEILIELNIPFDSCKLQNAGCNAAYLAEMFRVLLSKEFTLSC